MKITIRLSNRKRKNKHGFHARMSTKAGRNLLARRRAKGRKVLSAWKILNTKLTQARRLSHKRDFDRVFACGYKIDSDRLSARIAQGSHPRLGVTVSRHYGNAVRRHKFKRRVRAIFREHYNQLPDADIVISAGTGKGLIKYEEIVALIDRICGLDVSAN